MKNLQAAFTASRKAMAAMHTKRITMVISSRPMICKCVIGSGSVSLTAPAGCAKRVIPKYSKQAALSDSVSP